MTGNRRFLLLLSLLICVLCGPMLGGCGSNNNVSLKTDYDPGVDFSQYHTFAYQPGRILLHGSEDNNNTLLDDRIRRAVTSQLQSKGLESVTQNPDLVVTYVAGAQNRQEIESTGPDLAPWGFAPGWYGPRYYGPGGWWGPGYNDFWIRNYTEGTLILDLIDAHARQLVWRAYLSGEVSKVPDQKTIDRVAATAFKKFPPEPKKR